MTTPEVVEELKDFRNWVKEQLDIYEKTHKTYYYPSPESIMGELDNRIDKMTDELKLM